MPTLREIARGLEELVAEVDAILDEPDESPPSVSVPAEYEAFLTGDHELVPRTREEIWAEHHEHDIERLMRNRRRDSMD